MNKHTPGPWTLEANDSVVVMSGQAVIVAPAPDGEPFSRQQANARLIAAAPDLLAMLERCDRLLATIQSTSGEDSSRCIQIDRDSIRQLIAKVKGGSMKLTICKSPNGAVALRSDRGQVCEMLAGYDQTRLQDAQHIAHCVNVHDKLVEVLGAIIDNEDHAITCGARVYGKGSPTWDVYEAGRRALKMAKQ